MVKRLGLLAATVIVCIAPVAARGEETPTTRPERRGTNDHRNDVMIPRERFGRERLGTFDPASRNEPLTEQDKAEIQKFMETYSPNRWKRLEDVPNEKQSNILRLIRRQYRTLQLIKEEDPQIYELRLKRLPIEDEMFALGWQLKHDDSKEPTDPAALRSRLREQVRRFVDSQLQEQQLRIDRFQRRLNEDQQRLKQAQEKLAQLSSGREARIEKGVADIENERTDAFKDLAWPLLGGGPGPRKMRDDAATAPSADSSETPAPPE